ncbi:hypothetical protein LRP52_48800 [Photobacterium sp. ZSDE20]|uniref:Uncharacterized protein n=1 Tax=Photobacterium pectinilyticum TaxID=2906793 RepID=A0ABT1N9C1_9GAMM|nr:conjugative transfer protein MobI(A/C) [Photobacterium sp. ZSDE20]MCQ1061345.1 hypothetical protein [Photobacterium sp. ZSDE20]MDD1830039.1 hypothetical protein [Photobacterium sp. ZSDE20]
MKNLKDLMLPGSDGEEHRLDLDFNDLKEHQDKLIQFLYEVADELRDTIDVAARKTSDQFWQVNRTARSTAPEQEQGRFGTRVKRRSRRSLEFHWYINRFWADKSSSLEKKMRIASTHLSRAYKYHHDMRQFKSAPEWEQFAIQIAENRYKHLRQQNEALTQLVNVIGKLERLQAKFMKEIE